MMPTAGVTRDPGPLRLNRKSTLKPGRRRVCLDHARGAVRKRTPPTSCMPDVKAGPLLSHRQTDRQTETETKTNLKTERQRQRQSYRQTRSETETQSQGEGSDRKVRSQRVQQASTHTDTQTHRHTDAQTHRRTDRDRDRDRDSQRHWERAATGRCGRRGCSACYRSRRCGRWLLHSADTAASLRCTASSQLPQSQRLHHA
eukprot:1089274-Rhodomonas_salina.1